MAKSVISPSPRGLNVIAEYTLTYDLPTGFQLFPAKTTQKTTKNPVTISASASHNLLYPYHVIIPFNHQYSQYLYSKSHSIKRNYVKHRKLLPPKCLKHNLYDQNRKRHSKSCLKRFKRYEEESIDVTTLTVSQRMFYDLIEKWSLLHGFLPRYCFMRTLCESSQLLLPYGQSLLHDIVYIMLRYTKPWAFRHKIFGRALRQRYSMDECAKLYGPYCRASWLEFITNVVHGDGDNGVAGTRTVDFMR
ncbi:hypothetical protein DOY81_006244 [Sarcophaga bullata]|nr:hypothetical protein DOY81_006244 [Sarcophaga bullata]